ncbi:hypothetical protein AB6C76_04745, partial [Vibrio splendidus]
KPATVNSGSRVQIPIPPPPLESPLRNQRAFLRLEFGKEGRPNYSKWQIYCNDFFFKSFRMKLKSCSFGLVKYFETTE